jgi:catechol 2,3-dioxygenase-like lactoylglutathione lyase family enzyme
VTGAPAGHTVALAAALLSVRQLDRSVAFYEQVFGLRVHTRHRDLALLESADGAPVLALRAIGEHAARGLEQVGISRLVWFTSPAGAARLREHLRRAGVRELFLDDGESDGGGATVVFTDPDGVAHVLVASEVPGWPGHDAIPRAAWLRGL